MRASRLALASAALVACVSRQAASPGPGHVDWLVVAPHPDDEALIASGVLAHAVASGGSVAVVVMTNGDFDCVTDGLRREGESVAGLAALGVPESRVHFLGYPDGALARLGRRPLAQRRIEHGACLSGSATYGARGADGGDFHRRRFGAAASYTRESAVSDLATLLAELSPHDVAITHPEDTHPDHAATYAIFREALERVPGAPRVHRAIVHNGDCWPLGTEAHEPCAPRLIDPTRPMPPLTGRLGGYEPRERIAVPASFLLPDPAENPKLRAIAAHASQTRGSLDSYLFAFAKSDEPFFPEEPKRRPPRWSRAVLAPGGRHTAGGYVLEIGEREARLRRATGASFRAWPLPDDLWERAAAQPFAVAVEPKPEDGPVTEVSVACRGELVGVAVDVGALSAFPSARHAR